MNDDCFLPQTGSDAQLWWLLAGLAVIAVGVVLLLLRRRGPRGGGVAALIVLALAGVALTALLATTPAVADCGDCFTTSPSATTSRSATPSSSASPSLTRSTSPSPSVSPSPSDSATPSPSESTSPSPSESTSPSPSESSTPTPTPSPSEEGCTAENDKSRTADTDGDLNYIDVLGDGVSASFDLDSDNDSVLDLFESGMSNTLIAQLDADRNGIIDADVEVGANGLADVLETSPDSGVLAYTVRDADGDLTYDFLDLTRNGVNPDLYEAGNARFDTTGGTFISTISDADLDGIQLVVDSAPSERGAPGSPLSHV